MQVNRIFHPVGQGAFYTEAHGLGEDAIRVVYDCGGSSVSVMKSVIDHHLPKGTKIAAVFISHLHQDHINGLEHLLKRCEVKKIVLPALTDSMKALFVVESHDKRQSSVLKDRLILDPQALLSKKLTLVTPEENKDDTEITLESLPHVIGSGSRIGLTKQNIDWQYVPFNFQYTQYADKLLADLNAKGITLQNLVSKLKTDKKSVIDIFKNVMKGVRHFNANSLCLFSGSTNTDIKLAMLTVQDKAFSLDERVGCLYTGDFEAKDSTKFKAIKQAYSHRWSSIGTIQIPHHGSEHNYQSGIISAGMHAILSAGKKNKHKHPSSAVVSDINASQAICHHINEIESSRTSQYIRENIPQALACHSTDMAKIMKDCKPECFI